MVREADVGTITLAELAKETGPGAVVGKIAEDEWISVAVTGQIVVEMAIVSVTSMVDLAPGAQLEAPEGQAVAVLTAVL